MPAAAPSSGIDSYTSPIAWLICSEVEPNPTIYIAQCLGFFTGLILVGKNNNTQLHRKIQNIHGVVEKKFKVFYPPFVWPYRKAADTVQALFVFFKRRGEEENIISKVLFGCERHTKKSHNNNKQCTHSNNMHQHKHKKKESKKKKKKKKKLRELSVWFRYLSLQSSTQRNNLGWCSGSRNMARGRVDSTPVPQRVPL